MAKANPCFSPEAFKFLRALKRNNRREWFEPRKHLFEQEIKRPMLSLISEVTAAMESFAPEHVRPPEKSLLRIYRDVRFSSDKSPYKQHIAAWWTRAGLEKTSGAGFYLHIAADEVVIAAGVYMPERAQLLAIRSWLLEHHEDFRKLLNERRLRRSMKTFEGLALTRPPRGVSPEHPAIDLLKCRQWGVAATLPVEAALKPSLPSEVIKRFRLSTPLVSALNEPLSGAPPRARKPLFALY
ncbi:MAG TPA: DUF2461 domain-containing protein [Acidisarcina sp.]